MVALGSLLAGGLAMADDEGTSSTTETHTKEKNMKDADGSAHKMKKKKTTTKKSNGETQKKSSTEESGTPAD